jgi:hypothetical protein
MPESVIALMRTEAQKGCYDKSGKIVPSLSRSILYDLVSPIDRYCCKVVRYVTQKPLTAVVEWLALLSCSGGYVCEYRLLDWL